MDRPRAWLGCIAAVLVASCLTALTAAPAHADDRRLPVDLPWTTAKPDSTAVWHDVGDTLCVVDKGNKDSTASLTIDATGRTWRIRSPFGDASSCTGNLPVPEDRIATLKVCATAGGGTRCATTRVFT